MVETSNDEIVNSSLSDRNIRPTPLSLKGLFKLKKDGTTVKNRSLAVVFLLGGQND